MANTTFRRGLALYASGALLFGAITIWADEVDEKHLTVTATAFNSTAAQTDARPLETACGDWLEPSSRIIAVSRDLKKQGLDCGTRVSIEGLKGTWTVADVTAARHRQLIDIYMGDDIKRARKWGRQRVKISWDEPERLAASR
jgi:3D (Asp-Asp-Asp) domain-containing protein